VKNNPSVDIVMVNFNKGPYLEEAINSVILQKYNNWNLIIIDNCSTDNSRLILKKFKEKKNIIKIFFLAKNMGAAFSRNLALRLSRSKYIAFLDSDDYWTPNKLIDQISFMEIKKYDFTYTDYTTFVISNGIKVIKKKIVSPNFFNFKKFINDTTIATSSVIIKKSAIGTVKFPRIKTLEDYCFKSQILKNGNTAIRFNSNSMFYRILKNSLSSNKFKNIYWLFYINKKFNKISLFQNIKSIINISISSLKKKYISSDNIV
jgi:teichuronic acid biosynthesis glycosyltransferase TuaG